MRRLIALAAIAALYALPATAAPTAAGILAANKQATVGAGWDSKATLKTSYDYSGQGMTGKTHSLTDVSTGHFADDFAIGPMSGANGFDGKDGWAKDPSGAVTVQAGGDQRKLAVNEAYRRANAWWQPDFGGAEISYQGSKTDAGATYDVLKVTPKDGKDFQAWFDAKTHLLMRTVEVQSGNTITVTLSDYKSFDGVMLPVKGTIDDGNGAKYVQTVTLTDAKFEPKQDNAAFSPPKVDLNDFTIAGGAKEATFPIQIINNHIFGRVMANGKGPYTFIFDTGGHNLITPKTAKKLALKMVGTMPGQGVGNKVEDIGITKLDTVDIADKVTLEKQTFFVLDFTGDDDTEGFPMEGMIGFEGFRRFVTQIDYSAGTMTLMLPSAFDPKDAGTPIPFEMNGQIPQVKGSFEGIAGLFDIDTGARDEITLTGPFVAKEGLRAKHPKGVEAVDGWGVGGPARGYVTRGGELMLGNVTIPSVVSSLSLQEKGSFSDASYAGNVGGGVLKRFVVTFDYEHRIMYLKPAAGPLSDIGTFDRSGMWVNGVKGGYKIMDVTKGGAAEAAGLKVGEIITAIDGKPASGPVYAIRKTWRNEAAGTRVALEVGTGKAARKVKLVLKDQI